MNRYYFSSFVWHNVLLKMCATNLLSAKQFVSSYPKNTNNNKNRNHFCYFKNRLEMKFHVLYCRGSVTNSQLQTQSSQSCLLLVLAYSPSGTALFIQPPEEADEYRMTYGKL